MDLMKYLPMFGQNVDQQQAPSDDTMMQLEMQRRMKFADALRQQEAPQGQMVSGHYVAPSWTQHLAGLANKYIAGQEEKGALKQYGEYQKSKQLKQAEALKQMGKELQGTDVVNQGSYDIQVPNGQAPQTENLGGMQPIETGMKTISVPMATTTTRAPTTAERYAAIMKYGSAINDPRMIQEAIMGGVNQANKAEETAGERAWREQQTKNEQEFQRIQAKDRQGFELTQQEKGFANQFKLQQSSQGFQAGENAKNRDVQLQIHNASKNEAPSGYKKLLDGTLTFVPGGPADPNMKGLTQDQANARLYGTRMTSSHNIINNLEGDGKLKYSPIALRTIVTGPIGISDSAYAYSDKNTQSASQAMRDFINATLRRESGASISAPEFDNAIKQYFPQPGEDKSVIAQKRAAREIAIKGILDAGYMPGQTRPDVGATGEWKIEKAHD